MHVPVSRVSHHTGPMNPLFFPFSSPTRPRSRLPDSKTPGGGGAACPSRSPSSLHLPFLLCDLGREGEPPLGRHSHPMLTNVGEESASETAPEGRRVGLLTLYIERLKVGSKI